MLPAWIYAWLMLMLERVELSVQATPRWTHHPQAVFFLTLACTLGAGVMHPPELKLSKVPVCMAFVGKVYACWPCCR